VGGIVGRDPGVPFAHEGRPASGRAARTFKPRRGRLSDAKRADLEALVPPLLLAPSTSVLDRAAVFGRVAPLVVDIGFGMGESTAALAVAHPDVDLLAVDIHTPGFVALARALHEAQATNVRIVAADALDVLTWMVAPGSLAQVRASFPDPWPKASQRHRRLVDPSFAGLVATRLEPGGTLHLATDWPDYADQMLEVLSACRDLTNEHADEHDGWAPRDPERPCTRYEQRGIDAGRPIRDLVFRRTA